MSQRNDHASAIPKRRDGAIHVCPLHAVPDTVVRSKASHLLTWLQDEIVVETPRLILPDRHLRFHIHDISEPLPGYIPPGREHIDQLIEFAHQWNGQGAIVVHCWAGISRSTAAAYTTLCAINPNVSEEVIARRLRHASQTAYPNRLMVRLADAALGRQGRMMRAIEAIGRGLVASEGLPFSIAADHSDPDD
jgi:predicted protein tyrosine phosphatase